MRSRWLRLRSARVLCVAVALTALSMALSPLARSYAQTWTDLASSAACAQLAGVDRTATNSSEWGRTLLPGHEAPGGWFGVDICGNGINTVSPGGANVSCDGIPSNMSRTGCAPGRATYDGFGLSFQCVELVVRFSAWAFGDQPSGWQGDAQYLWLPGNHPTDFSAHPNGSSQAPVPGDILVWGTAGAQGNPWPDGPAGGHVAVVASVQGGNLTFVEENALSGQLNVPRETTSLVHQGGQWIVGGSLVTHAGTRMLFGWLHSWKNSGKFTGSGAVHGTPPASNPTAPHAPTSADPSVHVPSITASTLSTGVAVTADGNLADLSWPAAGGSGGVAIPAATPRSLGAPAGVSLAPDQVPAVMVMPDGTRDIYVRGDNGQVYVARTLPQMLGVTWRSLGTPDGVHLTGSVEASAIPGGLSVGALGTDGSLWWRGGPAGNLGSWTSAGRPNATQLHGAVVLSAEAGSGLPMALALGENGRLYETFWLNGSSTGAPGGWGQWTQITLPTHSNVLVPSLLAIAEPAAGHDRIGSWPDVPLDVFVADTGGTLWMLHLGQQQFWRTTTLTAPVGLKGLIGGVALAADSAKSAAPASSVYHLYAADSSGVAVGTLQLDTAGIVQSTQWAPLAQPPADGSLPAPGNAVALTSDQSVLISGQGPSVQLTGTRQALSLLGVAPPTGDVAITHALPGPATFNDNFSSPVLDPRWLADGSPAQPAASGGEVYLDPATAPARATMLQGAAVGNFSITTRVMLPVAQQPNIQVGLILTLDGGNWLTFGVDRSGVTSLCASAWWQASPCQHAQPGLDGGSGRSLFLRVTRFGDAFIALASHDGNVWTVAGKWTAPAPASGSANSNGGMATATPAATARATSTPTAPATQASATQPASAPFAFTAAGLFAQASAPPPTGAPAQVWPLFLYYDMGPSAAGE